MPSLRQTLTFTLLLLTWWITNNIYAIDAEHLFTNFTSNLLYIDLTVTQTLLGILFTQLYIAFNPTKSPPQKLSTTTLVIGSLHFLGTLLTNLSYSLIGSTTTLMWKLTEPLAAVILKRLVLSEHTTPLSHVGVFLTLSGVLLFSKSSFTIPTFSPIILSNIIFPTRNVFIKLSQREFQSTPTRFFHMLLTALPLAFITLLPKLFLYGTDFLAWSYMLRNAFLFNAYQIASFLLLERLDALTHSLLNTMKRFTGILLSMIVIRTPMHPFHFQGIGVTILGFCVYIAGGSKYGNKFGHHGIAAIAIAVALTILTLCSIFTTDILNLPALDKVAFTNPNSEMKSFDSNEYAILMRRNYDTTGENLKFDSYENALLHNPPNTGNLVWQYGAVSALANFNGMQVCYGDDEECVSTARESGKKLVQYLPLACVLDPTSKMLFKWSIKAFEEKSVDAILIVGIGVQAEFGRNTTMVEFNPKSRITYTSDEFPVYNMTKQFLKHMDRTGGYMLLRGDFTHRVIEGTGFKRSFSVGCPSLWINHDIQLGRTLEEKYKAIAKRIGDPTLKIAVTAKGVKGFRTHALYIRDKYPNARFYCQARGDVWWLQYIGIPFERMRFFSNVEDWMDDLREMDISYGVRIHGNMIAMGAGLPVIVVAPDWRVLELVEVMKLPHLTIFDNVFEQDIDIARLTSIAASKFNGTEFDRNRCKIGKVYIKALGKYGIPVREHVERVAESC